MFSKHLVQTKVCAIYFTIHVFQHFITFVSDHRAATVIQATWRGYWAREHNTEVVSVRKEIRARRAEDHIVMLRAELDRLSIIFQYISFFTYNNFFYVNANFHMLM